MSFVIEFAATRDKLGSFYKKCYLSRQKLNTHKQLNMLIIILTVVFMHHYTYVDINTRSTQVYCLCAFRFLGFMLLHALRHTPLHTLTLSASTRYFTRTSRHCHTLFHFQHTLLSCTHSHTVLHSRTVPHTPKLSQSPTFPHTPTIPHTPTLTHTLPHTPTHSHTPALPPAESFSIKVTYARLCRALASLSIGEH